MDAKRIEKERTLENHLRLYRTFLVGMKNCEKQLSYIMPNITTKFGIDNQGISFFAISDTTANFAINRIEGNLSLKLLEEMKNYRVITESIQNALAELTALEQEFVQYRYFEALSIKEIKQKLGYSEDKSVYRIRRHVLDKLVISLNNLLPFS